MTSSGDLRSRVYVLIGQLGVAQVANACFKPRAPIQITSLLNVIKFRTSAFQIKFDSQDYYLSTYLSTNAKKFDFRVCWLNSFGFKNTVFLEPKIVDFHVPTP